MLKYQYLTQFSLTLRRHCNFGPWSRRFAVSKNMSVLWFTCQKIIMTLLAYMPILFWTTKHLQESFLPMYTALHVRRCFLFMKFGHPCLMQHPTNATNSLFVNFLALLAWILMTLLIVARRPSATIHVNRELFILDYPVGKKNESDLVLASHKWVAMAQISIAQKVIVRFYTDEDYLCLSARMRIYCSSIETWPRGYKNWVNSQTQNKAQWLAACGHVSASSQSLRFILSLRMNSSFITSRPDVGEGLGWTVRPTPLENHKWLYDSLKILVRSPLEKKLDSTIEGGMYGNI